MRILYTMMNYLRSIKFKNIYRKTKHLPQDNNIVIVPDEFVSKEIIEPFTMTDDKTLAAKKIQSIMCKRLKTCPICYENFITKNNLMILSCGHFLHRDCFYKLVIYGYTFCPYCKNMIEQLRYKKLSATE